MYWSKPSARCRQRRAKGHPDCRQTVVARKRRCSSSDARLHRPGQGRLHDRDFADGCAAVCTCVPARRPDCSSLARPRSPRGRFARLCSGCSPSSSSSRWSGSYWLRRRPTMTCCPAIRSQSAAFTTWVMRGGTWNPGRLVADPPVSLFEFPGLVDHPIEPVEQLLVIERAVEIDLQVMQERRIDFHLIHQRELEVVLGCAQRPEARLAQQHGAAGVQVATAWLSQLARPQATESVSKPRSSKFSLALLAIVHRRRALRWRSSGSRNRAEVLIAFP